MTKPIVILILFIPLNLFSQSDQLTNKSSFDLTLNAGLNVSKFRNDNIDFTSGSKPFIGTSISYRMSKRFGIKGSAEYSIKSSSATSPYKKIENQYFDLTFSPRFHVTSDLYLHAGVSYYHLLKSNEIITDGPSWSRVDKKAIEGYGSEINVLTGIEFKLQDNMNFTLNYIIPTSKTNTSNFQIGLNFALINRIDREPSYRRKQINASYEHIKLLSTSTLLVRLKTSENTINALRNAGNIEKANKLRIKQETENVNIVSAFKKHFDYCDVRYFYSDHSNDVRQKRFNGIFLNDSLHVDNSIEMDTNATFFIAEFGFIEQDTTKMFSHYSYEPSENGGVKKVANFNSTSSGINFYALRILDSNFVQLNKPFPYYKRAIYKTMKMHPELFLIVPPVYLAFLPWSYDETVLRMNGKLKKFYDKSK